MFYMHRFFSQMRYTRWQMRLDIYAPSYSKCARRSCKSATSHHKCIRRCCVCATSCHKCIKRCLICANLFYFIFFEFFVFGFWYLEVVPWSLSYPRSFYWLELCFWKELLPCCNVGPFDFICYQVGYGCGVGFCTLWHSMLWRSWLSNHILWALLFDCLCFWGIDAWLGRLGFHESIVVMRNGLLGFLSKRAWV